MTNHFSTPWLVFKKGSYIPKGSITAHPGAAFVVYFLKIRNEDDYDPVINLIRRSPSMLALLEKAWPIIEVEAMNREEGGMLRDGEPVMGKYFTEMRELANEISAEIDRARGKGVSDD